MECLLFECSPLLPGRERELKAQPENQLTLTSSREPSNIRVSEGEDCLVLLIRAMFLTVGHCCLDDVVHVWRYPDEDSTVGSRTTHNR
jgi:hypothetical protein